MQENILKLLNEYKETEALMLEYIDLLKDKDYAQGKLDLIKSIISDLENLLALSK